VAGLGGAFCIVSGGAAPHIAPALKVAHQVVDNIVLVGLHAAATGSTGEMRC
jgi:type III pantothenate kinase